MAHPTFDATVNSVSIASTLFGMNPRPEHLEPEFKKLMRDYVGMVNRVIWLTLQRSDYFIDIHSEDKQFTRCLELHKKFLGGKEFIS